MIYFRIDERNRIIDIVDASDPHVMIGNPVGLVESDMDECPNVELLAEDLIPLYKLDGKKMVERDLKEIESDRSEFNFLPEPEVTTPDYETRLTALEEKTAVLEETMVEDKQALDILLGIGA